MKLITKIRVTFLVSLIVCSVIIYFGLTAVLMRVATKQMEKQAKTFGLYLLKNIEELSLRENSKFATGEAFVKIEDRIFKEFEKAIQIAKDSESFMIDEIILINPEYKVEVGYPATQKGQDYTTHKDIVDNFKNKKFLIGNETHYVNGKAEVDIDIVSFLNIQNDKSRVLEIKLNFRQTILILENQYSFFKIVIVLGAFFILVIVMFILLYIIRRTAIIPAIKISDAMENVGNGDLEQKIDYKSNDEFGLMASRFNEMVNGLKEKLHLSKYVSQSTIDAVKKSVESGKTFHTPERKRVTIFFSDIRGFTSYSEKKDPAYIIKMLNKLLSVQTSIIEKYGGDIDKFVGDETMAVFNSPENAIKAGIEIQKTIEFNKAKLDNLQIGIGILEGEIVQGDVGSEEMKDFTIIGDNVNTAARLQSVALGGEIIIPQVLAYDENIKSKFKAELKGKIKLKGKEEEMNLFCIKYI